ncbi:hypothetical protein K435DRAFT_195680 [Dendrothele bispora CBS 962.96]|uniref:Uncharacterized protein n=1 Tax=Dendrothele bispora (strain CBS 962.96) TaxID=1314807 RepID=A0A4V4HHW8_DENBC|nr:hypothetical protein K435DRAFT_195680 [Dendrothele bispora CBS 962.96]
MPHFRSVRRTPGLSAICLRGFHLVYMTNFSHLYLYIVVLSYLLFSVLHIDDSGTISPNLFFAESSRCVTIPIYKVLVLISFSPSHLVITTILLYSSSRYPPTLPLLLHI